MTLEDPGPPLPLNLVATSDLVNELEGRFDVFIAAGIKLREPNDTSFQFGVQGNVFDLIAMLEYLKVELVLKQIERHNGNGNGSSDFD